MKGTLNELMEVGHVVYSDGNGTVTDECDQYGPELIYVELDDDESIARYSGDDVTSERHSIDMAGYGDWELLHGFAGQHGYNGHIMHESEYIGGSLERHIRENAGYYVAVIVHSDRFRYGTPDSVAYGDSVEREFVGWAVAYFNPEQE